VKRRMNRSDRYLSKEMERVRLRLITSYKSLPTKSVIESPDPLSHASRSLSANVAEPSMNGKGTTSIIWLGRSSDMVL